MNEIKIDFFNCENCTHKNVCKHTEIDVPEFMNEITGCIDNFSYDKSYLSVRIICEEFQALSHSVSRCLCY